MRVDAIKIQQWLKFYIYIVISLLAVFLWLDSVGSVVAHGGGALGRETHYGYFHGNHDSSGTYVFSSGRSYGNYGMPVDSANQFVNRIRNLLSSGNAQDRTGAAFIINTMLGYSGSSADKTPSNWRINTWEDRVRQYDSAGLVDWNRSEYIPTGTLNSYYQGSYYNDDAFYYTNYSETQNVIRFRNPNGSVAFKIKKNCGNPLGVVNGLPQLDNAELTIQVSGLPSGTTVSFSAENHTVGYCGWSFTARQGTPRLCESAAGNGIGPPDGLRIRNPSAPSGYYFSGWSTNGTGSCSYSGASPGKCINLSPGQDRTITAYFGKRTYWNYIPQRPSVSPVDSATGPKPGQSLTATSRVYNSGDGRGASYWQEIQRRFRSPEGTYTAWSRTGSRVSGLSGINATSYGSYISRSSTVPSNARHNSLVCYRLVSDPRSGQSSPSLTITDGRARGSSQRCRSVYNLRFNLLDNMSPSMSPSVIAPDTTNGDANFTISNTGTMPSGATRGPTTTITVTASATNATVTSINGSAGSSYSLSPLAANASRNVRVNFTVNNSLTPGDEVCITLRFSPDTGYSDGTGTSGSRSNTICRKIGEHPYLTVQESGVWAGGVWDPSVIGSSLCSDTSRDVADSFIAAHNDGNRGSFADYSATALSSIAGFDTTAIGSDLLTFANQPSKGDYSDNFRCVTDYYELLSKDTTLPGVTDWNVNSLPGTSGQFISSSSRNFSSGPYTIPSGRQAILVVDGNVTIGSDIIIDPSYSASSGDDVPFLMIVASGDITIHSNVREIYGIFVARNKIYTCHDQTALTLNKCAIPLAVNGAFVAEDVEFRRTNGGILRGGAAEEFIYFPELMLANPPIVTEYAENFRSMQIKELPPIY